MQTNQTTQNAAYAFMILIAGFMVTSNYGRDSALAASGPEAPMSMSSANVAPGYGPAPMSGAAQYGLVQTGVVAIAQIDGTGRHSVMPIFQIVQLQSAAALASGNVALDSAPRMAPSVAESAQQQQSESKIPQGINVAPPASMSMSGTVCEIKGVRVLTETATTCATAGGQVPAL